jgi:hypothetical protein
VSAVRRGSVALIVIIAAVVALSVGARALWNAARDVVHPSGCTFADSTRVDLDPSQNAATMVSVVISRKLPERAAVLALGAALQESKLTNIPSGDGDRDSVGILQQRPSQGWGTAEQLSDVRYATGRFLDELVKVPNWQTAPLSDVIQSVQVSADGSAYAKHEQQAQQIADGLMGTKAAAVSCSFDKPTKVASATSVASRLSAELPVTDPVISGSRVTIPGAGWPTAAWLVAHANNYGIDQVAYDGKRWQRSKGWHDDPSAASTEVIAEMAAVKS